MGCVCPGLFPWYDITGGLKVGVFEGSDDGVYDGMDDGNSEGDTESEGTTDGDADGALVGKEEGTREGALDGAADGMNEGELDGAVDGVVEGAADGNGTTDTSRFNCRYGSTGFDWYIFTNTLYGWSRTVFGSAIPVISPDTEFKLNPLGRSSKSVVTSQDVMSPPVLTGIRDVVADSTT